MVHVRSGLIGGGAVAVGVFLAGFVLRVSSDVMAIGLGLVFVVGAVAAMLAFEGRRRPQPVSQPVSQPVVQPVAVVRDNSFDGRQPLPVINNYRAQPAQPASQPAATSPQPVPQPVATGLNGHAQAADLLPPAGVSWSDWVTSDVLAGAVVMPAATAITDDDAGVDGVKAHGALLPRREPMLTDYPLIWEVIEGTRSQNAAIKELWGSKDDKTLAWVHRVRNFYTTRPKKEHTPGGIILWEVEQSGETQTLEDVAGRLGVPLDRVSAAVLAASRM